MKVFCVTVLVLAVFLSESKGAKMGDDYQMASLDSGNYKVMWKYDMIKDSFHFNLTVKATGWVGFGVAKEKGAAMENYDMIVGGARGMHMNETYSNDYYSTSTGQPPADTTNDWTNVTAMEDNGYTILIFYRPRKTADTSGKDVEIKPGKMYLAWAYHATNDVNPSTGAFMYHGNQNRGIVQHTFIDAKWTIVTLDDNYRLYWAYDKNTDMFYFTVVVKATGWVAFGVSNEFPTNMKGYDVMIGGVMDSNNMGYVWDYLTSTRERPPKDAVNNWNLTSYEQRDGYTKLTVHRKRDTDDNEDVVIKPGNMTIVWAYHATKDVPADGAFERHTKQGGMKYTFIQDTNGGDGGDGGDGGKDSSAVHYPSIFGIIALLLFQFVMRA